MSELKAIENAAVRNALKVWFPWLACPELTDHDVSGADTVENLELMYSSFGGQRETLCDDCRETAPLSDETIDPDSEVR